MTYLKTITAVGLLSATFLAASTASATPPTSGAYVNDEQRFFVEGQPLTDAIEQASAIICYMASMRPDSFVNDGAYVAKIYEDRCETSGANATSEQASATATSSQSSTTASSSTSSTSIETEQALEAVLDVRLANADEPVKAKVWVEDKAQDEFDLDTKIYIQVNQTGGVSDEAPNGEFEMWFSMHLDGDADLFGKFAGDPAGDDGPEFEIVDGQALGQGYLKASGTELQYKEFGRDSENNIAMDFLASGDVNGIYGQFVNICDGCGGDLGNDPGQGNGDQGPDDGGQGPDDGGQGPDDGGQGPDDGAQGPDDGGQGPGDGGFDGGGSSGGPSFRNIMAFYQFYLNKQAKTYCKNYESAFELCFSPNDSQSCAEFYDSNVDGTADGFNRFEPQRIELSQAGLEDLLAQSDSSTLSTDENGALVTEECYSIDQSDATRNVFRYGVYNQDGSRLSVGDSSAFPMFAEVSVDLPSPTQDDPNATRSVTERVFGFADYWGVFIDPRGRKLIAESGQQLSDIDFKREVFGPQESGSASTSYNVAESEIRVEKRTKSYQSLNDIDKIRIGLHVQDPFWNQEYKQLLGLDESSNLFNLSITGVGDKTLSKVQEFQGAFEKDTYLPSEVDDGGPVEGATPGVFVFDTAVAFQPFWDEVKLSEKIYFKPSDWVSTMKKEETFFGPNGPETFVNTRPMGVWSNDTHQWYDISAAALNDPTLSDPAPSGDVTECSKNIFALAGTDSCRGGIRTETQEYISASDLTESLACMGNCLTPSRVEQTFLYAYCARNASSDAENCASYTASESGLAPSPFANVGPFLKNDATVIEIDRNDPSALSMTDDFHLASSPLLREGFRLASPRAQLQDYVFVAGGSHDGIAEDQSLPRYTKLDRPRGADPAKVDGTLFMNHEGGLNYENLVELVSGRGGQSPVATFDLMSAPPVGDSGSTPVTIELRNMFSGTRLMATIPVEWASTAGGFTLTVPAGSSYDVKLLSDNTGIDVTATVGNSQDDVFAYGGGLFTNGGRSGFTMRLLSLFSGDLGDVGSLNLETFIEPAAQYELTVNLGSLQFGEGPIPTPGPGLDLNALKINFTVSAGFGEHYNVYTYQAGQYWDGIRDSEVIRFSPTSTGFAVDGTELTKGAVVKQFLSSSSDPFSALGNTQYAEPNGFTSNINWGLRSGHLVAESDLAQLECQKRDGDRYENHPEFSGDQETETRYCEQKLFDSVSLTTYQIQLDTQPSYVLLDAAGDVVTISPPRTLYYEVPNETSYGLDAGKRLSLEFAGHGELRGIPGFIYDVATDQELGQFAREWKDTYRFINRFNIPDGGIVTDADGDEYFVKALDGEEWLQKLGSGVTEVGNYSFERSRLAPNQKMRILGDPNFPEGNYIGEPPTALCDAQTTTDCLINSGEPAVVHGEVVFDPTPIVE
ncbi:MAG: hypothetical protein P8N63_00650 [Pseudomonadales bacterium]|nr:hypothetical protein [Pseudomonadales bacterium]